MNKQQIRDKLIDWWIPDEVIEDFYIAIQRNGDNENAIFDDLIGNGKLMSNRNVWMISMIQHDISELWDWMDECLASRYEGQPSNDVWDANGIAYDAYERWFMNRMRDLLNDNEDDTLVE